MSVIGANVTVIGSSDPSKTGKRGEIVLETANTLLLRLASKTVTLPKAGTVLLLEDSGDVVNGAEIGGRLEDRLRARKR